MTVSIFELVDKALDHLYTVNNVLPDTVDDEVTEELGNAIEICEKSITNLSQERLKNEFRT